MNEIGAFEAKNTLGSLLDRVERGEEIVITRHGKAVARLIPNNRQANEELSLAVLGRIRQRAKRLKRAKLGGLSWAQLKKLRDEGRP